MIINELYYIINDNDNTEASVVSEDKTEASFFAEILQEDASMNTKRKTIGKIASSNQDDDYL